MDRGEDGIPLIVNLVMSGFASVGLFHIIPKFRNMFIEARLSGIDMNKLPTDRPTQGRPTTTSAAPSKPVLYVCTTEYSYYH